jgi:hypothetical protein
MNTRRTPTLEEAVTVVRDLPDEMQQAIASEMLEQAESFVQSQLTAEQRAIVKDRMAAPRTYVPRAEVMALLRKYNPAI